MKLKIPKEFHGELVLIAITTLMWLLILFLFRTYGYGNTWRLWNIPSWRLPFLDFRAIPGSAESFSHGYEPSVENPFDPQGRKFNYPAIWRLFFYTGITQDDTVWMSVLMIVLFFTGVFVFPKRLSILGAIGILLVIFSPASMLLYERGNADLIVFFLCVLVVLATDYSATLTASLVLFSAIVKMFPFFGITVLLKESKKRFWWLFGDSLLVFLVYIFATWTSTKAVWDSTGRGDALSYGTGVFVLRYRPAIFRILSQWLSAPYIERLLKYGPILVAFVLLLVVAVLGFMNTQQSETQVERNFAAFRVGASIYVGTFLLGNNFDYRLVFLILTIPQLMGWMNSVNAGYRIVARVSRALILAACWALWTVQILLEFIFHSAEDSRKFWFILNEISHWTLFVILAYLLLASAPDWLKAQFRSLLPHKIVDTSTSIF